LLRPIGCWNCTGSRGGGTVCGSAAGAACATNATAAAAFAAAFDVALSSRFAFETWLPLRHPRRLDLHFLGAAPRGGLPAAAAAAGRPSEAVLHL